MIAQQFIQEGNLAAALQALQNEVRKDASNAKHRIFLFRLLSVMGNWTRALNQLDVAGTLDADAMNMVQTYREAIQCEALRREIFSGKRPPLIFGEPQSWIVMLLEALRLARQTVWDAGLGQRMLATDNADYALMDIRQIEFDTRDQDG